MTLSGEVPGRIQHALEDEEVRATLYNGWGPDEVDSWAVHAGGRSILDAVEKGLELPQGALFASRDILARYGNMSSATLMFVLSELIGRPDVRQGRRDRLRARASPPRASISSGLHDLARRAHPPRRADGRSGARPGNL